MQTDELKNNLKLKTIESIVWSTTSKFVRQLLQFISTIFLSRIILPEEYGILGMLTVLTGFAQILNNMGLPAAIIQKKDIQESQINTLFWTNLILGITITTIFLFSANIIAKFYQTPILENVTKVFSIVFFINALYSTPEALLQKKLEFKKLFFIDIISVSISGILAIISAIYGLGIWSLIVQVLSMTSSYGIGLWIVSSWRPKLVFRLQGLKRMINFSINLAIFNILNYTSRNFDNLIIGKYLGGYPLGIYSRAYQFMLLPVSQVNQVLSKVMFPSLSYIQNDIQKFQKIYLLSTRIIALITFPLMIFIIIFAPKIILILYGKNWLEVAPILQVFSLYGLLQSIGTTVGWIYNSLGKTDILAKWGIFSTTISIASIVVGIKWGIIGIAISYTFVTYIILWYPGWKLAGKQIGLKFSDMLLNLKWSFFTATLTGIIIFLLQHLISKHFDNLITTLCGLILYISFYLVFLKIFNVKEFKEFISLLKEIRNNNNNNK